MKLTSVEIHAPNFSTIITLSFRDPMRQDQYNVKSIVGLDADEIISKYYAMSSDSKTKFNTLVIAKREVVFSVALNPAFDQNQSYSDLRDTLYKMISSSRSGQIQLWFKNGDVTIAILYGFITKFETPQTEQVPDVKLTIKCDEPFLIAPDPVNIPVGGISLSGFTIQDDQSTATHGFKFQIHFTASVSGPITITDPYDSSWFFTINPPLVFLSGDVLTFSSEYNNRYLIDTRASGTVSHMADSIVTGSSWPIIFPGTNNFRFSQTANMVLDSLSHSYHYWGV